MIQTTVEVGGMACSMCEAHINDTVRNTFPVDKVSSSHAKGKTVIIASTRGGVYSTSEGGRAMEHQESYLQTVLGFFGVTDVRFVRAEGVAMGDAAKAQAMADAAQAIRSQAAANQPQATQAA